MPIIESKALEKVVDGVNIDTYVRTADAITKLNTSLAQTTGSSALAQIAQEALLTTANRSRIGFGELAKAYTTMSLANKDLGISQQRLLTATDSIASAMTISGSGAQNMQAALSKLSEAMDAGVVSAEQLKGMMSQSPRLAKALADGLDVPIAKLKEMAGAGQLSADQVVTALQNQNEVLAKESASTAMTVEQAYSQLTSAGTAAVASFDKATGTSAALARAISSIAGAVGTMGQSFKDSTLAIGVVMGGLAGATALSTLGSIPGAFTAIGVAVRALGVALTAHPAVLALLGVGTAVGLGVAAYKRYQSTEDGINASIDSMKAENARAERSLKFTAGMGPRYDGEAVRIRANIEQRNQKIREKEIERADVVASGLDTRAEDLRLERGTQEYRARQQAEAKKGSAGTKPAPKADIASTVAASSTATVSAAATAAANKELGEQARLLASISGLTETFSADWARLTVLYTDKSGVVNVEGLAAAQAVLLAQQPAVQKAAEEDKKALDELQQARQLVANRRNKESEELAAAANVEEQTAAKSIQSVKERIGALQSEEKVLEKSRALNVSLAQAVELVAIERLKKEQAGRNPGTEAWQIKQDEIDTREELLAHVDAKASREKSEETAKKTQEQWKATADSINKSLTDAFMKSLESGKDFGKNLREALKEQFKNLVLKPTISAVMSPISGVLSSLVSGGASGVTGSGGSNPLSTLFNLGSTANSAYNLYQGGLSSLTAPGSMYYNIATSSIGQSIGLSNAAPIIGNNFSAYMPAGTQLTSLGSGAGAGAGTGTLAGAGWFAAIALAIINAAGGMRSETMVGSGLRGTLDGKRNLEPWEEWREGGGLFFGPEFTNHNPLATRDEYRKKIEEYYARPVELQNAPQVVATWEMVLREMEKNTEGLQEQVTRQSTAINAGYNTLRTSVADMANSIGLAGSKVEDFALTLEMQDLNFQGLEPEEIQAKITAVMEKAGNSMAKELLGYMKPVTEAVVTTVQDNAGQMGADTIPIYSQVTETTTKMVYQASQYAKAGETAYETLTRLSTSFNALNDASNSLGFGLHEGSVALADFASDFIEAFGGLEQFSASTSLFLQNYYSDEERRQAMARTGAIRAQELGIDIDAEGILNLSKQDVRNAANSLVDDPVAYRKALDLANYLAPLYQVTEAVEQAVEPTQSLATAVDELTEKFNGAKEALLNDAKSLSVDLLRAQGKEGEAKALERQQYLDGFVDEHGNKLDEGRLQQLATQYDANAATRRAIDVQNERNGLQDELNALTDDATQALTRQRDALDESNRALFDNVQAIKLQKTIADELPGVVDKYLSPAQRRQSQYDKVTADLNAVGIKVSADQLMGLSRAQIGSAAMDIYNTAGVPDEARLAVVRAAGALADLKNADVDTAFAALERAVDAQRKVLDEAITELTSVFETARDAAKTLFGEVESAVQFQGDEGRAFISNALAVAQSTGYLPESEKFSKAVSDATGALGQQMFATQAESDYQRLVLANELKGLQDISGDQLEKAKDELEYLDEQLAEQRKQIDVLNGIDVSVQSVAGAISALGTAMNGARSATTLGGSGLAAYDKELGVGRNAAGTLFQRDDIRQAASDALEAGANPRDIYNVIKGSGFTLAQAGVILGTEPGSLENFAREMDWPVFHRGTRRVPRTGFALLQQGEAVIPAAYNPFAAGRGWSNSNDMLAAMEGVRAELIEVRRQNDALQRAAMRTADAVNGRPEAPMLVENV